MSRAREGYQVAETLKCQPWVGGTLEYCLVMPVSTAQMCSASVALVDQVIAVDATSLQHLKDALEEEVYVLIRDGLAKLFRLIRGRS